MRTDEYTQEYSDVVEWTHGELYEPMIGVDVTETVRIEAEVLLSVDGEQAWVETYTLQWVN